MNCLYYLLNECSIGKKYYIITETKKFFIEKKGSNHFKKDCNLESDIISFKYVFNDIENIKYIYTNLINEFPSLEFGAHFHSTKETAPEKIKAAHQSNCFRFDSALGGIGGCPMAQNDLVGNLATEEVISYFEKNNIDLKLNKEALLDASMMVNKIFI